MQIMIQIPKTVEKPIDGANDGASGVGVLLEIARQLQLKRPDIGVDIILFDVEDYGAPQDSEASYSGEFWCLGSQYWAKNQHIKKLFGSLWNPFRYGRW